MLNYSVAELRIFYILTFTKHVVSSLKYKTHFGKVAVYLTFYFDTID